MSVNITVNGNYTKSCQKHNLLNDPERIKKNEENERRKMRIQQVRAVSKNVAKKLRNDVEQEKERQLKKIEEIKVQEMEMWRKNILAQQESDFKSAIFQVGTAHRAAQSEKAIAQKPSRQNKRKTSRPRKTVLKAGKENLKNARFEIDFSENCNTKPPTHSEYEHGVSQPLKAAKSTSCGKQSSEFETDVLCDSSSFVLSQVSDKTLESSSSSLFDSDNISKAEQSKDKKCSSKHNNSEKILTEVQVGCGASNANKSEIEVQRNQLHVSKTKLKQQTSRTKKEENPDNFPSTSTGSKKRFTQITDIIRQQSSGETEGPKKVAEHSGPICSQFLPTNSNASTESRAYEASRHRTSPTKNKLVGTSSNSLCKSSNISRPVSTQTTTSSLIPSNRNAPARVQFYDHNNKFYKEYEQPLSVVETHAQSNDRMNAMEQAELANELRAVRESNMESLRQKSAERCQKAVEREQVRRACEELTAKLDALTKQRQVLPSEGVQFSSARYGQVNAQKEAKRNSAVEDILKRPVVITCPEVNPITSSTNKTEPISSDFNLGSALTCNDVNSFNSSDSCCSILLGFVNGQSKEIADDIKKIDKKNGETSRDKVEKLKNLLIRINRLRECLINELEKCRNTKAHDSERVQTMLDSITELRKERENIFIDSHSNDPISKRESELKKKESILEKKLREFYDAQKVANKIDIPKSVSRDPKESDVENRVTENRNKSNDQYKRKNVEKEIEVPNEMKAKKRGFAEHELKSMKEKTINNEARIPIQRDISQDESEDEVIEQRRILADNNPVEIVIKVKGHVKSRKTKEFKSKSPRKLSTLLQNSKGKKYNKIFSTLRSNDSASTSYRSLPSKINNNVDEVINNLHKPRRDPTVSISHEHEQIGILKKKSPSINPVTAHYVQRLLGMSRTSINALAVSSSDIDTPSSSIINTAANMSAAETEQIAITRLNNVQKFIEDNYSFIGDLEESLRQSSSTDSSLKTIEIAWKNALKVQEGKKVQPDTPKTLDKKLKKTIIKNVRKPQTPQTEKKQTSSADKSTQLTHNCTQRIAELTEKINQVRKEKQKIIESTLSSASENERNSTEYMDLPNNSNNSENTTSRILDSHLLKSTEHVQTHSPDSTLQLEKNKSTGMSRDSGISLSRPMTVQETRDSPVEDSHPVQSTTESSSVNLKRHKPPISIARYSPQLVEDIPHELSTIFEVDTPATSRINASIHGKRQELDAPPFRDEQAKQITYRKFPTFEEYARINQLDMSRFDPEFSTQFEREFNEFICLAKEGQIKDYEEFTSFNKYFSIPSSGRDDRETAEELMTSLKIANLSFKRFPARKEYLNKIGISTSDLLDSMNLNNTEDSKNINSNSSSTESLMNIENELKLRKILTKPFHKNQNAAVDARSDFTSDKCPQESDISSIRQLTTGVSSCDNQSDNVENDLKQLGINWPSTMKKKTIETQALSSTNSSTVGKASLTPKKRQTKGHNAVTSFLKDTYATCEDTSQMEDCGRRLNLKEFLTKELLKRTTTSSSYSYSDDSIASSILRSIIESMASSPHQQANGIGQSLDRHKTSTPMASHSTSSGKPASRSQGAITSAHLFSGESRLSSVHFNNSSRDVNHASEENEGP